MLVWSFILPIRKIYLTKRLITFYSSSIFVFIYFGVISLPIFATFCILTLIFIPTHRICYHDSLSFPSFYQIPSNSLFYVAVKIFNILSASIRSSSPFSSFQDCLSYRHVVDLFWITNTISHLRCSLTSLYHCYMCDRTHEHATSCVRAQYLLYRFGQ